MQFDYEDFLFQQLERVEIFSNLEMLKIRNLKINLPLNPESETYCKVLTLHLHACHKPLLPYLQMLTYYIELCSFPVWLN